ncbi:hypothetical protein SETIT_8G020400v2 [Setaria italica]|uniref:Uncharacterized protein n=2 Tax=Setaria TaxID=4554 RepID=A0A368S3D8_SETIT|nr:hypothetical protein SETIT_8G020400v2 [Setaria italica]TKV99122.1 hypothetical protein SEVIR_8G022950v2 [Setaria viridis]
MLPPSPPPQQQQPSPVTTSAGRRMDPLQPSKLCKLSFQKAPQSIQ